MTGRHPHYAHPLPWHGTHPPTCTPPLPLGPSSTTWLTKALREGKKRNNIAAAKLAGLQEELNLSSVEFETAVSILFVGYLLMQIPSNLLLNKFGKPAIYLPSCVSVFAHACFGSIFNLSFKSSYMANLNLILPSHR